VEQHRQLTLSWQLQTPVPFGEPERLVLALTSLRALRDVRYGVRAFLTASASKASVTDLEDVVDRAVLVLDELTSNALRHGQAPASLHIGDEAGQWLIAVTDSAPDRLPTPARDRPAGAGGYGLYVIADLSTAHGVHYEEATKTVWASLSKAA
jgi:anti-sigma regulatory factor (Ser/Thr protein kinase)